MTVSGLTPGGNSKRAGEQVLGEAPLAVLGHHPGLEGGEEQRGRQPAQHAPDQQRGHVREVLQDVDYHLRGRVHTGSELSKWKT